jgi:hypothetical protein
MSAKLSGSFDEVRVLFTNTILSSRSQHMSRKPAKQAVDPSASNTIKDPDEWTTGDEPMTGAQASYLHTLATEAGETVEEQLTKAEASRRIDELQDKTGRGKDGR